MQGPSQHTRLLLLLLLDDLNLLWVLLVNAKPTHWLLTVGGGATVVGAGNSWGRTNKLLLLLSRMKAIVHHCTCVVRLSEHRWRGDHRTTGRQHSFLTTLIRHGFCFGRDKTWRDVYTFFDDGVQVEVWHENKKTGKKKNRFSTMTRTQRPLLSMWQNDFK